MDILSRHLGTVSKNFVGFITNGSKFGRRRTQIFITVRHNHITGSRQVLVNGTSVPFSRGTTTIFSGMTEIEFVADLLEFENEHKIRVVILPDVWQSVSERFLYTVDVDGVACVPNDDLVDERLKVSES